MITLKHQKMLHVAVMSLCAIIGYILFLCLIGVQVWISIPVAMILGFIGHVLYVKLVLWLGTKIGASFSKYHDGPIIRECISPEHVKTQSEHSDLVKRGLYGPRRIEMEAARVDINDKGVLVIDIKESKKTGFLTFKDPSGEVL